MSLVRLRALLIAWLALLGSATRSSAQQVQSSLSLGSVGVRYANAVDATLITLTPALVLQSRRAFASGVGTFSRPTSGGWSSQGQLAGSLFTSSSAPVAMEFGGSVGGSTGSDGARTTQTQGVLRGHAGRAGRGAWIGAGAGRTWDGSAWTANRLGEIGAWLQFAAISFVASVTPTVAADTLRFTDAQLALRWRAERVELDALVGSRWGTGRLTGVDDPGAWGNVSASVRVGPRVAVVASGGIYPLDLLQGFPSGRFASLGLRITGPGSAAAPAAARSVSELAEERAMRRGITAFRVRDHSAGVRELRVRAPTARLVEVLADFTGWSPVALTPEPDGWWTLRVTLPAAAYEMNVRLDSGALSVPPSLAVRRDEFGGAVGVLRLR